MYKLQLVIMTGRKKMKIGRKLLMLYFKNLGNKDQDYKEPKVLTLLPHLPLTL